MKFRKKPVVIDAIQVPDLTTGPCNEFFEALMEVGIHSTPDRILLPMSDHLLIRTLEGEMRADIGDWIIRGVKGEFYPCKPDIFEATYEPAKEQE